jgi:hypothetical protein
MNLFVRLLACLGLLAAVIDAVETSRPQWLVKGGLDWWNLPELRRQILACEADEARIDQRAQGLRKRWEQKRRLIADLAEDRASLFQAAGLFRQWDAERPPAVRGAYRYGCAGASDGERLCRAVLAWVRCEATADRSGRLHKVVCRLERDLEMHLCQYGTVLLPNEAP